MTATPYVAVDWTPNELIDEATMDAIANNIQWIYENKPNAKWTFLDGTARTEGVRILAGNLIVPAAPTVADTSAVVNFGAYFSSGSYPILVTTLVSTWTSRINLCVASPSGGQVDSTGFRVYAGLIYGGPATFVNPFTVNWMALGY